MSSLPRGFCPGDRKGRVEGAPAAHESQGRGSWRGVARLEKEASSDGIFRVTGTKRPNNIFLWEVGWPLSPRPLPLLLQAFVPSRSRLAKRPWIKGPPIRVPLDNPALGNRLGDGAERTRGVSQTSAWTSSLRLGAGRDLSFPKTPGGAGAGGRARVGGLEPLTTGPSPPLKLTLLTGGAAPAPSPLSGNVVRPK